MEAFLPAHMAAGEYNYCLITLRSAMALLSQLERGSGAGAAVLQGPQDTQQAHKQDRATVRIEHPNHPTPVG